MTEATIYLDYAATTPLSERVAARMREVQETAYANPSSNHSAGRASAAIVNSAARQLGELLSAPASTFLWTSGATEANNLAILGAAQQRAHRGKHLITVRTEHKAVVDVFQQLQKRGFDVSWLLPDDDGLLRLEDLEAALREDTQLVSLMHINNEIGCIQNISEVGRLCRDRGVLLHVDGAQGAGKIATDLSAWPVDLYSLTAHKFYGPKGVGALYVREGVALEPQLFGGGQQMRRRPGTLPTDLIAGLGEAAAQAQELMERDWQHCEALRASLWAGLKSVDGVYINGPVAGGYPGILNVGIDDIEGESLLLALEPLCVATGSACNSQSQEPSYVLRALGRDDLQAQSAIRFSLGRATTQRDIEQAVELYRRAIAHLRHIASGVTE